MVCNPNNSRRESFLQMQRVAEDRRYALVMYLWKRGLRAISPYGS